MNWFQFRTITRTSTINNHVRKIEPDKKMKAEVDMACRFVTKMLRGNGKISEKQLDAFHKKMKEILCARYKHHWLGILAANFQAHPYKIQEPCFVGMNQIHFYL